MLKQIGIIYYIEDRPYGHKITLTFFGNTNRLALQELWKWTYSQCKIDILSKIIIITSGPFQQKLS